MRLARVALDITQLAFCTYKLLSEPKSAASSWLTTAVGLAEAAPSVEPRAATLLLLLPSEIQLAMLGICNFCI
jgi:hypothetical protein